MTNPNRDWMENLSEGAKEHISNARTVRGLSRGEVLWRQGDIAKEFGRTLSGSLEVIEAGLYSRSFLMTVAQSGSCIGDMPAVLGSTYRYTVAAREATEIAIWKMADIQAARDEFPEINLQIALTFASRCESVCARLERSLLLDVRDRLYLQLQHLVSINGISEGEQVTLKGISHDEIARMMGCGRPTISRELKAIEKEGLISLAYGTVHVPQISKFNRRCEDILNV